MWPYHTAKVASLPIDLLLMGDRRMEAESYLTSGFGIRRAIETRTAKSIALQELAQVWQPNRLKGILVSPTVGTPFLAATQVFDIRPIPRKWLALERTETAESRFAAPGDILVTRSGAVGRATLATNALRGILISDDLLRVKPLSTGRRGWLYAFLRSEQARAMMVSSKYGHIIKHLEPSHLESLPVPVIDDNVAADFDRRFLRILHLRNESHQFTNEAESRFENALGAFAVGDWGESGFNIEMSRFSNGRRRLDGFFHNPGAVAIMQHLHRRGEGFTKIVDAGYDSWIPSRFRRIPASDGVGFLDSADLVEVNPDCTKRIADGDFGDPCSGRVEAGWVLMARSGQTYGIIGTAILAGRDLEGYVISDHVIRLKPHNDAQIRPGYLMTALTHPKLGRPLVKTIAYGSSIPEIDVDDLGELQIVRLKSSEESEIAELAEAAAKAKTRADLEERAVAASASDIVEKFMAGRGEKSLSREEPDADVATRRLREIADDPKRLITGASLKTEIDKLLS